MIASVFAFALCSVKTRETQSANHTKAEMIDVKVNIAWTTLAGRALDGTADRAHLLRRGAIPEERAWEGAVCRRRALRRPV